jgi:hypothetical protein
MIELAGIIECVDKVWYKKIKNWLKIFFSAVIGGAGGGIIDWVQHSGGTLNWKNLLSAIALGVALSVGNLMVHSPRHEGGQK